MLVPCLLHFLTFPKDASTGKEKVGISLASVISGVDREFRVAVVNLTKWTLFLPFSIQFCKQPALEGPQNRQPMWPCSSPMRNFISMGDFFHVATVE